MVVDLGSSSNPTIFFRQSVDTGCAFLIVRSTTGNEDEESALTRMSQRGACGHEDEGGGATAGRRMKGKS